MAKNRVKIGHFLILFIFTKNFSVKMIFLESFCDVLHHKRSHFDWHMCIGDLGYET